MSDKLRGSPFDLDPNEDAARQSKSLGQEIDLVVGIEGILPNVELDFAVGYFVAGDAFRVEVADDIFGNADDAVFARFELEWNF